MALAYPDYYYDKNFMGQLAPISEENQLAWLRFMTALDKAKLKINLVRNNRIVKF